MQSHSVWRKRHIFNKAIWEYNVNIKIICPQNPLQVSLEPAQHYILFLKKPAILYNLNYHRRFTTFQHMFKQLYGPTYTKQTTLPNISPITPIDKFHT